MLFTEIISFFTVYHTHQKMQEFSQIAAHSCALGNGIPHFSECRQQTIHKNRTLIGSCAKSTGTATDTDLVWQSAAGYVILELSFRRKILFDSLRIVRSPAAGVTPVTEPGQLHMDYLEVGWIIQQQRGRSLMDVSDIGTVNK